MWGGQSLPCPPVTQKHVMSCCPARSCAVRCPRVLASAVPTTSYAPTTVTTPASPGSDSLYQAYLDPVGVRIAVPCTSVVTTTFAGTLQYAGPDDAAFSVVLQFYNMAAPGVLTKVAEPPSALIAVSATPMLPITAVQNVTLTPGDYVVLVGIRSAVGSVSVTVSGDLAITLIKQVAS